MFSVYGTYYVQGIVTDETGGYLAREPQKFVGLL